MRAAGARGDAGFCVIPVRRDSPPMCDGLSQTAGRSRFAPLRRSTSSLECCGDTISTWTTSAAHRAVRGWARQPSSAVNAARRSTRRPVGRVQAGDGPLRRRGALHGPRRGGRRGAATRNHDRARRPFGRGGDTLRRHRRQVHRRRHHGGVRRAGGAGGPRCPRLSCGLEVSRRKRSGSRSRSSDATASTCTCGWG